jgi:hypothetical protein
MMLRDTEAANFLGLKPITLRLWRMQQRGPVFSKLGRSVRYSENDLQAFVETNKVLPAEPTDGNHAHD